MPGIWVARNGAYAKARSAWAAKNGVFSKVRDVDAAVGGVWKDSGVGGTPVAQAFYATLGADAHVALTVTWNVALSDGLPNPAADGVFITWESGDRSVQGRTEVYHTLASTALVYTYYPSVNWTLRLWALIDGEETYLGVIPQITTSGVPTPTNLQLSAALDQGQNEAIATLSWNRVPFAESYTVLRYYNGTSDVISVPQSDLDVVTHYQAGLQKNTGLGYYVRAVIKGLVSEPPAYVAGRTPANYSPGWYTVPAQQKRTLIMGNKKTPRQWRPASNDKIFCGHAGDWNTDGTQVGFIFYWENAGTNPFQAVKDQLDRGGRCTALQIRLNRADNGYNYGIRPIVRTHVYKFWPGDGNTNGNMHEGSWHRGNPPVAANEKVWVDIDPAAAPLLVPDTGNGIALGSTANKKDDYMVYFKEDTGLLRFKIE